MSHANTHVIYPQSIERNPATWQVREGDEEDNAKPVQTVSLLDLHDRVIDRLDRAKALTYLLQTADTQMDGAIKVTAILLEELIEQAQVSSERVWKYVQREKYRN
jgi:hypothetical protein